MLLLTLRAQRVQTRCAVGLKAKPTLQLLETGTSLDFHGAHFG
jgi:hypothetical protein